MSVNGQPAVREPVPHVPYEINLNQSLTHYEQLDDGGMMVAFTPAVGIPGGLALIPPQVRVFFDPEGWERFKRAVAADGAATNIAIAHQLPPSPPALP